MIAGCRADHTLPLTSIHCGRGVSPVVITTSLDQTCKIYSLADGAPQYIAPSARHSTAFPLAHKRSSSGCSGCHACR